MIVLPNSSLLVRAILIGSTIICAGVVLHNVPGHNARIYSKAISVCNTMNNTQLEIEIVRVKQENLYFDQSVLSSFVTCFDKMVYVYTASYHKNIMKTDDGTYFWIYICVVFFVVFCLLDKK
jgi:hypothetical protein